MEKKKLNRNQVFKKVLEKGKTVSIGELKDVYITADLICKNNLEKSKVVTVHNKKGKVFQRKDNRNKKIGLDDEMKKYIKELKKQNIELRSEADKHALHLRIIDVNKARGKGLGTQVMNKVINWADKHNKTIDLVPAGSHINSRRFLMNWYSKFGFVENKAEKKDDKYLYMYRKPNSITDKQIENIRTEKKIEKVLKKDIKKAKHYEYITVHKNGRTFQRRQLVGIDKKDEERYRNKANKMDEETLREKISNTRNNFKKKIYLEVLGKRFMEKTIQEKVAEEKRGKESNVIKTPGKTKSLFGEQTEINFKDLDNQELKNRYEVLAKMSKKRSLDKKGTKMLQEYGMEMQKRSIFGKQTEMEFGDNDIKEIKEIQQVKDKVNNKFENWKIFFKDKEVQKISNIRNQEVKRKDLIAKNKKTGEEILLGELSRDYEWYSKNPSNRINDSVRKINNFHWIREGLRKFINEKIKIISRFDKNQNEYDFITSSTGTRKPPKLSNLKEMLEKVYKKYNNEEIIKGGIGSGKYQHKKKRTFSIPKPKFMPKNYNPNPDTGEGAQEAAEAILKKEKEVKENKNKKWQLWVNGVKYKQNDNYTYATLAGIRKRLIEKEGINKKKIKILPIL